MMCVGGKYITFLNSNFIRKQYLVKINIQISVGLYFVFYIFIRKILFSFICNITLLLHKNRDYTRFCETYQLRVTNYNVIKIFTHAFITNIHKSCIFINTSLKRILNNLNTSCQIVSTPLTTLFQVVWFRDESREMCMSSKLEEPCEKVDCSVFKNY